MTRADRRRDELRIFAGPRPELPRNALLSMGPGHRDLDVDDPEWDSHRAAPSAHRRLLHLGTLEQTAVPEKRLVTR